MQYSYKAKNTEGKVVKGIMDAENEVIAQNVLREKDLFILEIKGTKEQPFEKYFKKKIAIKDKIIFTEQLGIMIKSGISIVDGLRALEEETENKNFAIIIKKIISDIEGGSPFSKALEKHKEAFSEIYVNMVKSGEQSGKIDLVLVRLSSQLEKEYELKRKIKGALAYPIFVLFALVAVMVLVITYVIPQLKAVFDDAGVSLPLLTRILINISVFLQKDGIYVLIIVILLAVSIIQFRKTISGKKVFDTLLLRIPIFGMLLKKSYMAQFTRTFSSLVASGLPLMDVFKVAGGTIGNVLYEKEIEKMAEEVKAGQPISSTLKKSKLMPKMVGQLAAVGEKSGNIDEVFDTLADFFDRDVDNITSNLSSLLEPVIMVVMGVGIGLVIVAIYQPIYGLVNAI